MLKIPPYIKGGGGTGEMAQRWVRALGEDQGFNSQHLQDGSQASVTAFQEVSTFF